MTRINDKNGQLNRWLARVFPPSSPQYAQPSELDNTINLVSPVLPPSLLYERAGYQTGITTNPGTQLFFPSSAGLEAVGSVQAGVPNGKIYYIIAARFEASVQASAGTGRAWIALKNTAATFEFAYASNHFSSTTLTDFVDLRVGVSAGSLTNTVQGGGGGPMVVPPGYTIHFSTAATPAAATVYVGTVHYVVCDIGELLP